MNDALKWVLFSSSVWFTYHKKKAIALDRDLFKISSVPQLMEIAGLSVATCIRDAYEKDTHKNVLVVCGCGNNGGDGFITAKYLKIMGYNPQIYYPVENKSPMFVGLKNECMQFGISFVDDERFELIDFYNRYRLIVDAVFGFSYKPPTRVPFASLLLTLEKLSIPICSIDVPSGWYIDDIENELRPDSILPDSIVSLSAPKLCTMNFTKRHYLAGRFLPSSIASKYGIDMDLYKGSDLFVKLT